MKALSDLYKTHYRSLEIGVIFASFLTTITPAKADLSDCITTLPASCGEIVSGSLAVGDTHCYSFDADSADIVNVVTNMTLGYADPVVELYSPDGDLVNSGSGGGTAEILNQTLLVSGSYTILVFDSNMDEVGDYSLTWRTINYPPCDAVAITCGEVVSGSLVDAETDVYTFDAEAGNIVNIVMNMTLGYADAVVELYAPNGTLVSSNAGGGTAEILNQTLPMSGSYIILAYDNGKDEVGDYNLTWRTIDNPPCNSVPIACGEIVSDSLVDAETDIYTFSAEESNIVNVVVNMTVGYADAVVELYAPDGTIVSEGSGGATAEILNQSLPASGSYSILVYDSGKDEAGDYNITWRTVNDPPCDSVAISCGEVISGSLVDAETDIYSFSAEAGDVVNVVMNVTVGYADAVVELYAPDGTLVGESSGGATAEVLNQALPVSGSYSILVYDNGKDEAGDYNLSWRKVNDPPCDSVAISCGEVISDSLVDAETDIYSFSAEAGDVVNVVMNVTVGYVDAVVELYSPDGTLVGEGSGGATAEILNQTLPASGSYSVLVYDNGKEEVGNYNLSWRKINDPPCDSVAISCGEVVSDSLVDAETDIYTFSGEEGSIVNVVVNMTVGYADVVVELYAPDGTLVNEGSGGATAEILNQTLPASGLYSILVYDSGKDEAGDYSLSWRRIDEPTCDAIDISCGEIKSDSLVDAKTDIYTLDAEEGNTINVVMNVTLGYIDAVIELYSPEGTLVESATGGRTAEILNQTLPTSGSYSILVYDSNKDEAGDYNLTWRITDDIGCGAVPLSCGEMFSGSLVESEIDSFLVDINEDDVINIVMTKTGGSIEPLIELYTPDGTLLQSESGSATAEIIGETMGDSGTYTVFASDIDKDSSGEYRISWRNTNDPVCDAEMIECGEAKAGSLDSAEMEAYTFTADDGDVVNISMAESGCCINPSIELYSPDGTLIRSVSANSITDIFDVSLTESGVYTILATDDGRNSSGDYYLNWYRVGGLLCDGEALECGESVSGSLNPLEMDYYTLDAEEGDLLRIEMNQTSGEINTRLDLYSPDASLIASSSGTETTVLYPNTLQDSGTYTIVASDEERRNSGGYDISWRIIGDAECDAEPIPIEIDTITPNRGGNAGSVTVTISGNNLHPQAEVKLVKDNENEIVGVHSYGRSNGTELVTTFDLQGMTLGECDLVVINPDGQETILEDAFAIEEGGAADLWMEVVAPAMRVGRLSNFYITYGNSGNIDAPYPWLAIGLPVGIQYNLHFAESEFDTSPDSPPSETMEGTTILDLPALPAGSNHTLPISLAPEEVGSLTVRTYITTNGTEVIRAEMDTIEQASFELDPRAEQPLPPGARECNVYDDDSGHPAGEMMFKGSPDGPFHIAKSIGCGQFIEMAENGIPYAYPDPFPPLRPLYIPAINI